MTKRADRHRALRGSAGAIRRMLGNPSTFGLLLVTAIGLLLPSTRLSGQVPLMAGILFVLVFTYAWHPVGGILGEMSLAHIVFWAAGIYCVVLATNHGYSLSSSILMAALVGAALAGAVILFAFAADLSGLALLVFGLIFVNLASLVIASWSWVGGFEGMSVIALPATITSVYYLLVVYAALLLMVNLVLLGSRRGLVWLAIRDDASRIASLGWSRRRERAIAYTVTGAFCAIGGALQGAAFGYASPDTSLRLELIVVALLAVYVGGPGTIWGPLLGVVILEGLSTAAGSISNSPHAAEAARLLQYLVALAVVTALMYRQKQRRQAAMVEGERRGLAKAAGDAGAPDPIEALPATAAPGFAAAVSRVRHRLRVREDIAGNAGRGNRHRSGGGDAGSLAVTGLSKRFGGLHVLHDVSFEVRPGEILGLVGPNGAGKSTICNIIAGDLRPDTGTVTLGPRNVERVPPYVRTRLGLARTFQSPRVFPTLTLAENVVIAGAAMGTAEARATLEAFGVRAPNKRGESSTLMERRMVEIARLKALQPSWVMLDEPLAGLAVDEHDLLLDLVRDLASTGVAVLIVEHLVPVIAPVIDRLVVLNEGYLIADGLPADVLSAPEVVEAYLGQTFEIEVAG